MLVIAFGFEIFEGTWMHAALLLSACMDVQSKLHWKAVGRRNDGKLSAAYVIASYCDILPPFSNVSFAGLVVQILAQLHRFEYITGDVFLDKPSPLVSVTCTGFHWEL